MYLGTRAWKLGFGSISGQKPSAAWVFESDTQGFLFAPKMTPNKKTAHLFLHVLCLQYASVLL